MGAGGYIGFQLARVAVGTIDNAIIYGADSLMYVFLVILLLNERYTLQIGTFNFASFDFQSALGEGFLYAVACICFLQAFYYVDPIIVAISSYSLDLYAVLFNSWINGEVINTQTGLSAVLIALGSAILIRAEYKKFRKKQLH